MLPADENRDSNDTRRAQNPLMWVLVALLIAWLLIPALLGPGAAPRLPYSEFLDQVEAGNVSRVVISGDVIRGELRDPITWPPDSDVATEITDFETTFPEAVGDPDLLDVLEAQGVVVEVESNQTALWITILVNVVPFLLLIGLFVWMGRRAMAAQQGMFNFGRARARTYDVTRPKVTFDDVAGQEEAKQELREVVDFLKNPDKYHRIGGRLPRGILLVGPPGTGKTLMAKAVAGEAGVPFFNISATEFVEMFVGVGASRVRDLFEKAKKRAPAIIFIDELDAVGRRRGAGIGNVNDEREQTLNQLLTEMDGFDERENVIVLAATNRPDVLDPALLRPGRFDRQVVVGLPDREGRLGILRIHTRRMPLGDDVDLESLAAATTGMSGADLANLANEAALIAARRGHDKVMMEDFESALDKVMLGGERKTPMNDHDRRVVAYHEAGHAVAAWFTPGADPVRKVTIIPHGMALGATTQLPTEDRVNYGRRYLLGRIGVMLGGRVAEEVALDDISTGAESDLVQATRLARRMVTRWGMGSLGPIAWQTDDEQPFLGYELATHREVSPDMAAKIDADVARIIEDQHHHVRELLSTHRKQLEALVDALLETETVRGDRLADILGPRAEAEPGPGGGVPEKAAAAATSPSPDDHASR